MYKIRSMTVDAESAKGAKWTARHDARITLIGKIMRPLHIDELPQILNVLRGEMTVIGPRPERPEFVEKLSAEIPGYSYRTLVLPGLTGYAQLNLPADTGLGDVRHKLVLDLEYIEQASFLFDLRLLLGTACMVFPKRFFGTWPNRLCGIYRNYEDSPWAEKIGIGTVDDSRKNTDSKILRPRHNDE
jgi:lipopolysaccharide/colanic/teichoic acid biosynthesis glycosyltransferase